MNSTQQVNEQRMVMISRQVWRWSAVLATVALAACGSRAPSVPTTVSPVTLTETPGQAMPLGYVHDAGKDGVRYQTVAYNSLPQWQQQVFGRSLASFKQSCTRLQAQPAWQSVCRQAQALPDNSPLAKTFFERYFTPWQVSQNGQLAGTVTGYYEPALTGDVRADRRAKFPIYGVPNDFVVVPLPAAARQSGTVRVRITSANQGVIAADGAYTARLADFPLNAKTTALKGRVSGSAFVPYHTRAEINAGALNGKAPILGYADDPVELFFLQVQGSGRLRTPEGQYVRLGFADKNDQPYVSIGRYMANKGYLPLGQTSMQGIKGWLQQNPQKMAEVLGQNPSYVFFRQLPGNDSGPIGALGVPLSGGYSAAIDRHYITLGAPLFVATTHPASGHGLNRLLMAQDTGSAINGAVRIDYFWGYGDEAGAVAGKMKHPGYVWQLLPNGMLPEVR